MDIRTLAWDEGLLQRFGVSRDMLPHICSNAEVYGTVKEGPLAGVPIAGERLLPGVDFKRSRHQFLHEAGLMSTLRLDSCH